ncbi:MAG: hypothetical protein ACE5MK_09150, partial [Acidobacteriota bacterium]
MQANEDDFSPVGWLREAQGEVAKRQHKGAPAGTGLGPEGMRVHAAPDPALSVQDLNAIKDLTRLMVGRIDGTIMPTDKEYIW